MGRPDGGLERLFSAAQSCGLPVLSKDGAARLLAWLLIYGGGKEAVVKRADVHAYILEAQRLSNIYGGATPDREMTRAIRMYVGSVADPDNPPVWVKKLERRYGL